MTARRPAGTPLAAVDLGSNSFHLIVARVSGSEIHVVDRLRERVVLAEGLDARKRLVPRARQRALECLARFGERVRDLPEGAVRAVGTNTLRQISDVESFLDEARARLGHPVEVVSGQEEARLIYSGVAHGMADTREKRLVVDVGGGSTECIFGRGSEPLVGDSLFMGCVTWTRRHFPRGRIRAENFAAAELAARLELEPIERRYRDAGWQRCVGSSGTILAIDAVLRDSGWGDEGIRPRGLSLLREALVRAGHVDRVALPGLTAERADVLPGGLAIVRAVVDAFRVERMSVSSSALREGLLHDLLGRVRHSDVRDGSIASACDRHGVDAAHARRVERTALGLLASAAGAWSFGPDAARWLSWAARLHEIGLFVAFSGHHRHGAYLLENQHLAGFSRADQRLLAALVRSHRRKLDVDAFPEGAAMAPVEALRLATLLRLAVRLHRSRRPTPLPPLRFEVRGRKLALRFPEGWLDRHPLTRADLDEEAAELREARLVLSSQ